MCLCIQLSSFVKYYIIYLKQDRISVSVSANIGPKILVIGISVNLYIGASLQTISYRLANHDLF